MEARPPPVYLGPSRRLTQPRCRVAQKDDPKYRSVKLDNKKIKSDVVQLIGGLSLLHAAGARPRPSGEGSRAQANSAWGRCAGFHKNAEARTLDISPSAEKETLRKVRDLVDDALRTAA